jgi:hypothetical protein
VVPESVLTRPKQGFGLPRGEWDEAGFAKATSERLRTGELVRRGLIGREALDAFLERRTGRFANKVWMLLVLDLWVEQQRAL